MQEELICPYPGLRPFNEDEAIFFKGRDEHIEQITRQLEEKKFLMLTGASGDGKSSLVYAGLIPNARAGFFKAKFGNWIVVDFRPERSPLKNLADALSDKFGAKEKERFQNELQFGFSALIDIYTQSPYYVNKNSIEFLSLEEAEKKKATRKGANLMILVDQFEEFFTNTENYSNGKTSVDSQLVVNLILETSRIALEKDIPIYVVCTMRSDYIGQCASFRGLPEAIGFSQFFVPRLKRNEIYQVIQEPALLNGNKISKRLIEVLINEMNDGIDQLPVLQHALNQVWQIADNGKTEMDLIHFAKIGGLDKQYLTKDDKKIFDDWFEKIPEYKKRFFEHPSLDNVLDGHANDLYYRAYDYLKTKQPDSKITIYDTQLIIRNAFKCLTKIDQSRGVRNRMTLSEIVNIIDQSHITDKEVATVLEIFRLQGNTFLKPFYTEGGKENDLLSDSVLDITHESLIRNWTNLIEWAKEEDEDFRIWLDFEKQLQRWIANDKSTGYLLPIGPLNFFETWMTKKNPNKYWLVKYDESDLTREEKLMKAETLLKNAKQFIKRSSRKLFVSRTVLKYGAQRIAIILSSIMVSLSCIYLYFDYASKENENVLSAKEERGLELLSSDKVKTLTKAQFILFYENKYPGSAVDNIQRCGNDSTQIRVALEIFIRYRDNLNIFTSNKDVQQEANKVRGELCHYLFEKVARTIMNDKGIKKYSEIVRLFWILKTYEAAILEMNDSTCTSKINRYSNDIIGYLYSDYLLVSLRNNQKIESPELFNAISYLLITHRFQKDKVAKLIALFSPFSDERAKGIFKESFPKNSQITADNFALKYNGGYELLSSLYAYVGDASASIQCVDSIISYDNKATSRWNFGYREIAQSYWMGTSPDDTTHGFIYELSDHRIKYSGGNLERTTAQYSYESMSSNLWLNSDQVFKNKNAMFYNNIDYHLYKYCADKIFNWYENRIWKLNLPVDEKHFLQANILKYQAVNTLSMEDTAHGFTYMRRYQKITEKISETFLEDTMTIGESTDQIKTSRRAFLFFPAYVSEVNTWNFTSTWSNSANYVISYYNKWNILDKYDFNDKELNLFSTCLLNDINELPLCYANKYYSNNSEDIWIFIDKLKTKFTDKDKRQEIELLSKMMSKINPKMLYLDSTDVFLTEAEEKNYLTEEYYKCADNVLNSKLNILRAYLMKKIRFGKVDDVFKFLNPISNKIGKNNLILDVCEQAVSLGFEKEAIKLLQHYIQGFNSAKKPPALFYNIVGQIGGFDLLDYSKTLLKDSDENLKPVLFKYLIRGMVQKSEYHLAVSLIPESISSNSELEYINELLRADFMVNSDIAFHTEKSWLTGLTNWYDNIYETNRDGAMMVVF